MYRNIYSHANSIRVLMMMMMMMILFKILKYGIILSYDIILTLEIRYYLIL